MKKGIDLNKELLKLRKLMEGGKIKLYEDMAPELKKVIMRSDGTVVKETVSGKLRELLLEIRRKGE